jgi:hypothetical protein
VSTAATGTAAQARALRAAAAFIEQAGMTGLQVTASGDGSIVIRVPAAAGTPAARTAAVASLAAATGAPAPHRTAFGDCAWIASAGTIAGHPARVTTHIDDKERQHA